MVSGNGNSPMIADDDDLSLDNSFQEKAQLDTEELADPSFEETEDKVELDLEDAPFLEDDDEDDQDEVVPTSKDIAIDAPEDKPSPIKKLLENRKLLFAVIGGVLLLLLILVAWVFLSKAPRPEPPTPQPQQIVKQATPEPEEPPAPEYIVTWDPFWVELKDKDGNLRFLQCQFSAPTDIEKLSWEATSKKVVLRDAIFYYLRNKSLLFLSDKTNVEVLKTDILAVINQYMNNGQFEELLIESYLVK